VENWDAKPLVVLQWCVSNETIALAKRVTYSRSRLKVTLTYAAAAISRQSDGAGSTEEAVRVVRKVGRCHISTQHAAEAGLVGTSVDVYLTEVSAVAE